MTLPPPARKPLPASLLALGVALFVMAAAVWFPEDRRHAFSRIAIPWIGVAVLGLCLTPHRIRLSLAELLDRHRQPSAAARRGISLSVWSAASLYLGLTALRQHREF